VSELSQGNEGDEGAMETDRDRLPHSGLLMAIRLQDHTAGATAPNLSPPPA
jgi:hypothetical protein